MGRTDFNSIDRWETILKQTTFGRYIKGIDNIEDAFTTKDRGLRCIDEGCCGSIRMAGSGILNQDRAVQLLSGKVDGVYSHDQCGAAQVYARMNNLDLDKADQYGIEWSKKLAKKLGVPYKGHIKINEMSRPSDVHIAWVTYYDGTGKFDPSQVEELAPGFVISRGLLDREYAMKELEVSIGIALSSSGVGDRVTTQTPFIIVPIGNPQDKSLSLKALTEEAQAVAQHFDGKVIVSGFTAPQIALQKEKSVSMFQREDRTLWDNVRLGGSFVFLGGYLGVLTSVILGHFVNCMTGNSTETGVSLAHLNFTEFFEFAGILICFIFGAFLSAKMLDRLKSGHVPVLLSEAGLLITIGMIPIEPGVFLAALAMGLQNGLSTYTTWTSGKVRTTHVTGTTTDIGVSLANKDYREFGFTIFQAATYLIGAILGFFVAQAVDQMAFVLGGLAIMAIAFWDVLQRALASEALN